MEQIFETGLIGHFHGSPCVGAPNQTVLSKRDFDDAMTEITAWQGYAPTPLYPLDDLATQLGLKRIDYKHEGPRFGLGSFKALGGAYAGLRLLQRHLKPKSGKPPTLADIRHGQYRDECADITLVSATDGNHGRSLAWGCKRFGARCRIYIHAEVSPARAEAMRDLGAEVIRIDADYDASVALAREEAEKNGWFVVSDTSWPGYSEPPRDVMAGYGVMAREICAALDQAPTHVFLQGGVGGLAASVAAALRQHWGPDTPRVVVVEPDRAACLFESARQGGFSIVKIEQETIMAGLSCGEPSEMALEILTEEVSDYLTIPDDLVPATIRLLGNPTGRDPVIKAGESAVAGLAALIAARAQPDLSQKLGLDASSRVLLIGSEGVTDPDIYTAIMEDRYEG
jgi:diaminopropionate ammonia-lyase